MLGATMIGSAHVALLPSIIKGVKAAEQETRPNIVMLMTDDQTLADMEVMPKTRHLIGDAGVTFSNAFVSYSLCCPSRATYFTGQYAHNHGVLYNHPPNGGYGALRDKNTTFPVALQRAGYYTTHMGKYLNGVGGSAHAIPPGWNDFRGAVDPTTYNYYGYKLNFNGTIHTYPREEKYYRTDYFARMATDVIRRDAHTGHPFFLNVAFLAPHSAGPQEESGKQPASVGRGIMDNRLAVPPRRYRDAASESPYSLMLHDALDTHDPSFNEADMSDKPRFLQHDPNFRALTLKDMSEIEARTIDRQETLLAVDDAVQRIINTLRTTGVLHRTVVIFTSDNGFFAGEHRIRAGKYFVYDPSVRVPLLMRGPGIAHGVVRTQMVGNIDLAPTILALAHARPLRVMDGRSLVPLLRPDGATIQVHHELLFESGANTEYPAVYHAIRTERYLYVEYSTGDRELYDLKKDPYELQSRQNDPALRTERESLQRHLRALLTCSGATCR
jgi:N-acetylglucosamine-6-sulfatase